tara:strand:- start:586 stop:927 length:342 start_codon:yes stop_codon:yes gene_type:complete
MARYYCTCRCPKQKAIHPTEVDEEGVCTNCGYYAFARPDLQHVLFPRADHIKWSYEPITTKSYWSEKGLLNEYYLYFYGHEQKSQGISDGTLRKDTKRIQDEKELKRTNRNRG